MQGINIFSGEPGLGGALTNPTEISRRKGSIAQSYAVRYRRREWPDVESAYHALGCEDAAQNDGLMVDLLEARFRQHPDLTAAVQAAGGEDFLLLCTHYTNARSDSGGWEGAGRDSRFIRNLVAAYRRLQGAHASEEGQGQLF
jgi:hypothetical protein